MQRLLVLSFLFPLLLPFFSLGRGVKTNPVFSNMEELTIKEHRLSNNKKLASAPNKELALKALLLARNNNQDKELADAYQKLGDIVWNENNFSEAASHYYEARSLREDIKDSIGLIYSNISIGNIYLRQNHLRDAEYY